VPVNLAKAPDVRLTCFHRETDTFTEIGPHRIVTADSPSSAIATVRGELAHRVATGVATPPTVLIVAEPDAATRSVLADLHQAPHRDWQVRHRCGHHRA
jgi:hypothetical protein